MRRAKDKVTVPLWDDPEPEPPPPPYQEPERMPCCGAPIFWFRTIQCVCQYEKWRDEGRQPDPRA